MQIKENNGHQLKQRLCEDLKKHNGVLTKEHIFFATEKVLREQLCLEYYTLDDQFIEQLTVDNCKMLFFVIAGNHMYTPFKINGYELVFLTQKNSISKEIIVYYRLLDVLQLFKRYNSLKLKEVLPGYSQQIENLTPTEKKLLVKLVRKYSAFVRVLLAIILSAVSEPDLCSKVAATVNPLILEKYQKRINIKKMGMIS